MNDITNRIEIDYKDIENYVKENIENERNNRGLEENNTPPKPKTPKGVKRDISININQERYIELLIIEREEKRRKQLRKLYLSWLWESTKFLLKAIMTIILFYSIFVIFYALCWIIQNNVYLYWQLKGF